MLTRFVAVTCALALLATPCSAQTDKALRLIPDDALGFLLIQDLRSLSDKVTDTANRLNVPEKVSMLELIQKEMGIQEGINDGIGQGELGEPSGLLAGVGGAGPEGKPKKYPVLVARRGDFVLLAPMGGRAGLEAVLHASKDITATLKGTEEWLGQQDIA